MIDKKIKINTSIAKILEKDTFNNFTISQLKNAYINRSTGMTPVEARKFVYKQVLKLVAHGALTKKGDKHSRNATYKKTDLFSRIKMIEASEKDPLAKTNISNELIKSHSNVTVDDLELEIKLHEYKVDMMSAIGESDEYIRLAKSFPDMKIQLNEKYHLARDKSSKLLGQIKAVRTLMHLQESL